MALRRAVLKNWTRVQTISASFKISEVAEDDATSCSYASAKVAAVARPLQIRCRDAALSWVNFRSASLTLRSATLHALGLGGPVCRNCAEDVGSDDSLYWHRDVPADFAVRF